MLKNKNSERTTKRRTQKLLVEDFCRIDHLKKIKEVNFFSEAFSLFFLPLAFSFATTKNAMAPANDFQTKAEEFMSVLDTSFALSDDEDENNEGLAAGAAAANGKKEGGGNNRNDGNKKQLDSCARATAAAKAILAASPRLQLPADAEVSSPSPPQQRPRGEEEVPPRATRRAAKR